jgi:hypothetical protein
VGGLRPDQQRRATIDLIYGGHDGKPLPWSCRGDEPCAKGANLPDGTPLWPGYKPLDRAIALARPAVIPEFDIRGVTQEQIDDGVIRRENDRLDLLDLLDGVDAGTYRLVVTRPDETGSWQVVGDTSVVVSSDGHLKNSNVRVAGAADGLYGIQLFSAAGSGPVSNVAWVAAATAPGDAARRSAYRDAVAATKAWPNDSTTATFAGSFLRRVLAGLADAAWSNQE